MNKVYALGSAIALAIFSGYALAANLDDATRQQVYNTAYQNLSTEQHKCDTAPCGAAISSARVESIFDDAYSQVTGKQASHQEFMEWKYMSSYPTSISSDKHFPQASEVKTTKKSAAVKEMPEGKKMEEKKTETHMTKPHKAPCDKNK